MELNPKIEKKWIKKITKAQVTKTEMTTKLKKLK